jgi:5-methylcytosine-specific restriction endonuclease McrA
MTMMFAEDVLPFLSTAEVLDTMRHRSVDRTTRERILLRDGEVCGICLSIRGPFEIDHKIPVCRGGTHHDDNLWVLCTECNGLKSWMTVAELADLMALFGRSLLP